MPRKGVKVEMIDGKTDEQKEQNETEYDGGGDPAVASLARRKILSLESIQRVGPQLGGQFEIHARRRFFSLRHREEITGAEMEEPGDHVGGKYFLFHIETHH